MPWVISLQAASALHLACPITAGTSDGKDCVSPMRWAAGHSPLVGTWVLFVFLHLGFQSRAQTGKFRDIANRIKAEVQNSKNTELCICKRYKKTPMKCIFCLAVFQGLILWPYLFFHAFYSAWRASFWFLDVGPCCSCWPQAPHAEVGGGGRPVGGAGLPPQG